MPKKTKARRAPRSARCAFQAPEGSFGGFYPPPPGLPALVEPPGRPRGARLGAVILPLPYEQTVCYGRGARLGPSAILAASRQLEPYDEELGGEPAARWWTATLPPLALPVDGPAAAVAAIRTATREAAALCRRRGALFVGLGGEHTVSVGEVGALRELWPDLLVVQLDAHGDLCETYQGSRLSHACVARRILELGCPMVQLGVRSLTAPEARLIRRSPPEKLLVFSAAEMRRDPAWADRLAARVRGRRVFLSLDLDGLDPALMPATGTPEPGGLSWDEVLTLLRVTAREARLVGLDLVELAPLPGQNAPDFLAARLLYKALAYAWTAPHGFRVPAP